MIFQKKNLEVVIVKMNNDPVISLDYRSNRRIRIHKKTLELLGNPEYIQILVNPVSKTIAVRRSDSNDPLALKVNTKYLKKEYYELNSIELLRALSLVNEGWTGGRTYRIYGTMRDNNRAATFQVEEESEDEKE